jgi:hypothetical protein
MCEVCMIGLLVLSAIGVVVSIFFKVRNKFIYSARVDCIMRATSREEVDMFRSLPSYENMLYKKFWIWDAKKLGL